MNVFTTDHRLAAQPSWFDAKEHPVLSFWCIVFTVAALFTPAALYGLYCYFTSDIGAEPNPFPDPWQELLIGTALVFVFGVICTAPVVALIRYALRRWRKAGE